MTAKLGRPTSNPKGASQHIRLDSRSMEILESYVLQEKVSRAEAIRRGILKLEGDLKK